MNRSTTRRLVNLAFVLALAVLLATPVGAGTILPQTATPEAASRRGPTWLEAALTFVSGLLPKKLTIPTLPALPDPPLFGPNTGGCIDPQGNPVDCLDLT